MDNGNEKQLVGADPFKVQLKGATRAQLFLIVFSLGFSVLVILFQPKMFEASVTIIPGASSWNSNESTEFVLLNKNHPLYQGRRSGDAYITYGNVESLFLTQSFLDFITRRLSTEFAASDRLMLPIQIAGVECYVFGAENVIIYCKDQIMGFH